MVFDRGVQRTMKIRVFSDLHLEFQGWVPPKSDADTVVLAGDVHVGVRGIEWARVFLEQPCGRISRRILRTGGRLITQWPLLTEGPDARRSRQAPRFRPWRLGG